MHAGTQLSGHSNTVQQQVSLVLHAQPSTGTQRVAVHATGGEATTADETDVRFDFREVSLLASDNLAAQDFVLHFRGDGLRRLRMTHRCFDPLYYVLLFPYGDDGWHSAMQLVPPYTDHEAAMQNGRVDASWYSARSGRRITPMAFYGHRLFWRRGRRHRGSRRMLMGGRLLQEYCCTAWARTEIDRLNWHQFNQSTLRADLYNNLRTERHLAAAEGRNMHRMGRQIILGSSFVGGPRDISNRFQDAMAVVRETRRPSAFVTMTCNPHWPEIAQSLPYGARAEDHPMLVARVFKLKMEQLRDDLLHHHVMGRVVGYMSVVEFQYRGLPHVHILLIFDSADAQLSEEQIDDLVSAEIPTQEGELRQKVLRHMIHNDCEANRGCMCCQRTGRCRWRFPRALNARTVWADDGLYPNYRRRGRAGMVTMPDGRNNTRQVNDRWVSTYNPYLLSKYDCHINVEVCASLEAVKYLYKCAQRTPLPTYQHLLCPSRADAIRCHAQTFTKGLIVRLFPLRTETTR